MTSIERKRRAGTVESRARGRGRTPLSVVIPVGPAEVSPHPVMVDGSPVFAALVKLGIAGDDIVRVTIDVTKIVVERETGTVPSVHVYLLGPDTETAS